MKVRKLLTGKEAEEHFRVQGQTLRLWDKKGQIETDKNPDLEQSISLYEEAVNLYESGELDRSMLLLKKLESISRKNDDMDNLSISE